LITLLNKIVERKKKSYFSNRLLELSECEYHKGDHVTNHASAGEKKQINQKA
jgi:hypothetical protein